MPTTAQHRAKAEHNQFFVSNTDNPFWDWAIVGIFYCALQYIEAYLASQVPPVHPPVHQVRDSHIQRDTNLRGIYADYRQLEDESRDARYDASLSFSQADVARLHRSLDRIKATVCPLIPQTNT